MGIYVETFIRGPLEEVWSRTQDPALHQRWDLRFSGIEYLPRPDPSQPHRFRYSTRPASWRGPSLRSSMVAARRPVSTVARSGGSRP